MVHLARSMEFWLGYKCSGSDLMGCVVTVSVTSAQPLQGSLERPHDRILWTCLMTRDGYCLPCYSWCFQIIKTRFETSTVIKELEYYVSLM